MANIYVKSPDGQIGVIPEEDAQAAANHGYTVVSPEEIKGTQSAEAAAVGPDAAVTQGLLQAPADYSPARGFVEKAASAGTFGLMPGLDSPESRALGKRFQEEHPYQAFGAEVVGQLPAAMVGAELGSAAVGAAKGFGLAARVGAGAADLGVNAAVGGAQTEAETARLEGRDFSWTDAAITGAAGEVLGRGAAWGVSKAVGGARNLLAKGEREIIAQDAAKSLTSGGWVQDYRTAQHAERYHNELADLAARDLDTLESSFGEVSRQDKKRARIVRAVIDNPAPQHEIAIAAAEHMRGLRSALADEIGDGATGPAKKLAKQLDDRVAALDDGPRGKKLWRLLDENRQALQEYRQDLHQAYENNPGSAWLSREGLGAIDGAEKVTREALLREDAWGAAAAQMQREYNQPFHEQWFPARATVLKDLHFSPHRNAEGFDVFRGDPAKVRKFLSRDLAGPDGHRLAEQFSAYLDGAEAVARAGAKDSPRASRDALEAVRRLRKAVANGAQVTEASARTAARAAGINNLATVAGGVAGAVAGGPGGAALGGVAARGARVGDWLSRAGSKLGWGAGRPLDMAALLAKGELAPAVERSVAETVSDDIIEGAFRPSPSGAPPAGPGGPLAPMPAPRPVGAAQMRPEGLLGVGPGQPALPPTFRASGAPPAPGEMTVAEMRRVGVGTPTEVPEALPGVGPARRAAADAPAGAYAIRPDARPVSVGPESQGYAPAPPRGYQGPEMTPSLERELAGGSTKPSFVDADLSLAPEARDGSGVRSRPTVAREGGGIQPEISEGVAQYDTIMGPGAAARRADAARAQALTEGEFRDLVDRVRTAETEAPDGSGRKLADVLESHYEELKDADLIVMEDADAASAPTAPPPPSEATPTPRVAGGMSPGARAVADIQGIHPHIVVQDERKVAETIEAVFGDRVPTAQEWAQLMPLAELEKIGPLGQGVGQPSPATLEWRVRSNPGGEGELRAAQYAHEAANGKVTVRSVGGQVFFTAHGPTGMTAPFEEILPNGTREMNEGGLFEPSWKIARTYSKDYDGSIHVHHDFFFIRGDLQASGVGAAVIKNQMEAYTKLGVHEVSVDCAEVGRWFWPSIGFDSPEAVPAAVREYRKWLGRSKGLAPAEVEAAARGIKSLPTLANSEYGKEFLLSTSGDWNTGLSLKLGEDSPMAHYMRGRLDIALAGALALGGALEKPGPKTPGENADPGEGGGAAAMGAMAPLALFGGRVGMFKAARARIVSQVAKRLFSAAATAAPRVVARLAYSRAEIEARQKEFQSWQANPQELVDRVSEGFRDVPPEHQGTVNGGVFRTATFLKEKLPTVTKVNAVSLRQIPVSTEAMAKYARYEQSALRPREALAEASESGHMSVELLETLQELYPDLLAELRVEAYQEVRASGPPPTIQARVSYARLFDNDGAIADPAFSLKVAQAANYAFEQQVPVKPGPTGGTPGVSRQAQVVAPPSWGTRQG